MNYVQGNNLLKRLFPLLLLLALSPTSVAADAFWVLGSFADEVEARDAGSRISHEAGVEVLLHESIVDATVRYRLLTGAMDAVEDQAALRQQLEKAGIVNQWKVTFDGDIPFMETVFADPWSGDELDEAELADIDAMLSEFDNEFKEFETGLDSEFSTEPNQPQGTQATFVVAGSYGSREKAEAFAATLSTVSSTISSTNAPAMPREVLIKSAMSSGKTVYRVLVGPVPGDEEQAVMTLLRDQGVEGPWPIRGISTATPSEKMKVLAPPSQDISRPVHGLRIPGTPTHPVTTGQSSRSENEFNPVRLGKPASGFPDPRNIKQAESPMSEDRHE